MMLKGIFSVTALGYPSSLSYLHFAFIFS